MHDTVTFINKPFFHVAHGSCLVSSTEKIGGNQMTHFQYIVTLSTTCLEFVSEILPHHLLSMLSVFFVQYICFMFQ